MRRAPLDHHLATLQRIALKRGGALLSPDYLGDAVKLRWRCAEGHEFEQAPTSVKQGRWCRLCGRVRGAERKRAPHRDRLYRVVAQHDGAILSAAYEGMNTALRFRCAKGHEWSTVPAAILRGSWCQLCSRAARDSESHNRVSQRMARLAGEHGGTVLGSSSESGLRRFALRCGKGHQWWSRPCSLDFGTWCRECAREAQLERLHQIATERGGVLLTTEYVSGRTPVQLQCAAFHRFEQCPEDLQRNHWCPACGIQQAAAKRRTTSVARLQKLLAKHGGVVVSPNYINQKTPLTFRCAAGHEWDAMPMMVWRGAWCKACRREFRLKHPEQRLSRRDQLAARRVSRRLQLLAEAQGGRVLPPGFVNFHTHLELQCANRHVWAMPPKSLQKGKWCRQCEADALLADLRVHAAQHDGECLSASCRTVHDVLEWQCVLGHRFQLQAFKVRKGQWCPICVHGKRQGMDRMHQLAADRQGECLSPTYEGATTKLMWKCAEGHQWLAEPAEVFRGHWCPKCADWATYSRKRLSIEDMQQTATARGGLCLSKEYHGNKTALRWRCARGHAWTGLPNRIRQGSWCPVCARSMPGTLESMKLHAVRQGGRCLTAILNNRQLPLRFECAVGHRFEALISALKTGVWCPECRENHRMPAAPERRPAPTT